MPLAIIGNEYDQVWQEINNPPSEEEADSDNHYNEEIAEGAKDARLPQGGEPIGAFAESNIAHRRRISGADELDKKKDGGAFGRDSDDNVSSSSSDEEDDDDSNDENSNGFGAGDTDAGRSQEKRSLRQHQQHDHRGSKEIEMRAATSVADGSAVVKRISDSHISGRPSVNAFASDGSAIDPQVAVFLSIECERRNSRARAVEEIVQQHVEASGRGGGDVAVAVQLLHSVCSAAGDDSEGTPSSMDSSLTLAAGNPALFAYRRLRDYCLIARSNEQLFGEKPAIEMMVIAMQMSEVRTWVSSLQCSIRANISMIHFQQGNFANGGSQEHRLTDRNSNHSAQAHPRRRLSIFGGARRVASPNDGLPAADGAGQQQMQQPHKQPGSDPPDGQSLWQASASGSIMSGSSKHRRVVPHEGPAEGRQQHEGARSMGGEDGKNDGLYDEEAGSTRPQRESQVTGRSSMLVRVMNMVSNSNQLAAIKVKANSTRFLHNMDRISKDPNSIRR